MAGPARFLGAISSVRLLLSLCTMALLAGAGSLAVAAQPSGNPEHGREIAKAKCSACHGADGNSTDPRFPKLAGQKLVYLYRQLSAFKTGVRRSKIMSGIATALSGAHLADAAGFYAQQKIRPDRVKEESLVPAGKRIFSAGTPQVPACAMCHGSGGQGMPMMGMMGRDMMGMMRTMIASEPNLDGQHPAYIVDQLNRFASGERHGAMMGMMMGPIAAVLSQTDKKAVAAYLSGIP